MKRLVSLLVIGLLLNSAAPAFCLDDICTVAHAALSMTSVQMNEFFDDNIKGWTFEGAGRIYDVRARVRPSNFLSN